jgi:hypothetical protein
VFGWLFDLEKQCGLQLGIAANKRRVPTSEIIRLML